MLLPALMGKCPLKHKSRFEDLRMAKIELYCDLKTVWPILSSSTETKTYSLISPLEFV